MVSIAGKFGKSSISTDYAVATTVKTTRVALATVLECFDLSKFAPDTPVYFITYKKVTDPVTGVVSITNLTSWKALVNVGANTMTNLTLAPGYIDTGNDVGDFVECIPTSYWENSLIDALLVAHNDDGSLKNTALRTALNGGWFDANESWAYSSYDSTNKTGVITVPTDATTKYSVGMRVRFTNNSATQYGIITKVTSTTLTIYFGTDYSLTNSAITVPYFSSQKAPFGFPLDPTKWTVITTNTSATLANPGGLSTYINDKSISLPVPIGAWDLSFSGLLGVNVTSSSMSNAVGGISTSNNAAGDPELMFSAIRDVAGTGGIYRFAERRKRVVLTSATTYYLVVAAIVGAGTVTVGFDGSGAGRTSIIAVCAYL